MGASCRQALPTEHAPPKEDGKRAKCFLAVTCTVGAQDTLYRHRITTDDAQVLLMLQQL